MNRGALWQAVVLSIQHHRVRSWITTLAAALAVAAVVATTGRAEATRTAILADLETPAARIVRVTDETGLAAINASVLSRIARATSVLWVIGLGPVGDLAHNPGLSDQFGGHAGERVGIRSVYGTVVPSPMSSVVRGREPNPGEAVLGSAAAAVLGQSYASSAIEDGAGRVVAAVGVLEMRPPLEDLDNYVLVHGPRSGGVLAEVVVLARSADDVPRLVQLLPDLVSPLDMRSLRIEEPPFLIESRARLRSQLNALNGFILLGALLASTALVGVNVLGAVADRRRELGIRRTQGATRSTLAAIVGLEVVVLGIAGSSIGLLTGTALVAFATQVVPDPVLGTAVAGLVVLSALAGSLPATIAAAFTEPLYALRG